MAEIIDGKKVSAEIRAEIRERISQLDKKYGRVPEQRAMQ